MRLPLSPRGAFASLPLLALAFASGCPETPVEVSKASLVLEVAKNSADVGATIDVTFRSKNADKTPNNADVVATLSAAGVGSLGLDVATLGADTLTIAPTSGEGSFVFACIAEGTVTLTLTAGALVKAEDLRCRLPNIALDLDVDLFQDCATLQADASSSCEIIVTLQQKNDDGTRTAASQFPVTARVDGVTVISAPDPNLNNGNTAVLATTADGNGQDELSGLRTDDNGRVSFFVVSSDFALEQTIAFTVSAGAESVSRVAAVAEFNDASAVTIEAPEQVTSGETVEILVSAIDADNTPANGKVVTVTLPPDGGFTATPAAGLVITDNLVEVTLDATGTGSIEVIAPTVAAKADFVVVADFQAISESAPKQDSTGIQVNVAGAVTVNATLDRTKIDAKRVLRAVVKLSAERNGEPFNAVTAKVRVALTSRAVIKFAAARAGADGGDPDVVPPIQDDEGQPGEDSVSFASFVDGVATIDVVVDSDRALGLGTVEVEIVSGADITSRKLDIVVERDPILQSIVYVGSDPAAGVIGVQGSPLPATAVLTFKLSDDGARPIAGLTVQFSENASDPDVTVVGGSVATAADGTITAILNAGHVSGPVTVTARATFGDQSVLASSLPIAIVAGVPNSALSFLTCTAKAQFDPFTSACALQLADRFTNRVDQVAMNVQFRAEGGNIGAVGLSAAGVATTNYAFAAPGAGSADVRLWSYSQLSTVPSADRALIPGCFDNTTRTPCDLIDICTSANANLRAFCPLPPDVAGGAPGTCVGGFSADALATFDTQGFGDDAIDYDIELRTDLDTRPDVDVDAQVAAYNAEQRVCGFPLSCLQAQPAGLIFDNTDNCPVNAGCLDYSAATECPQSGLIDVLASVNGEEGFDDVNGNGVRDVDGINGARVTESFVDYPEPFLDKNSSCSFDDLNDNGRLQSSEKIRLSDIFIDDVDGVFGFAGNETNGTHDLSTEISFKTTIMHIAGGRNFQFGERVNNVGTCGADLSTRVACSRFSGGTSACRETALGEVFADECEPTVLKDGDQANYVFRWRDANGNCPSVDLAQAPNVTATGPILVVAADGVLDEASCGINPGAIGTTNVARPWCEEHPEMGSPLRQVSLTVDCAGLEGAQQAELNFGLGGDEASVAFTVSCPICGDGLVEGAEECDNRGAVGCGADCLVDDGFSCNQASPSVCSAN